VLDVSIRLSRNGFVPNEDIQVTVYANEVNVAIMNVRIELIQVVVYTRYVAIIIRIAAGRSFIKLPAISAHSRWELRSGKKTNW